MPGFYYTQVSPEAPQVGELVTFTADGIPSAPLDASWNFGDGYTATGLVVTHTYTSAGEYFYSALIDTTAGPVSIPDIPITVSDPSVVYTASFTSTASIGYAPFRPYFTDTSTPPSESREWIVNGTVQSTLSTWGAEFYEEYPSLPVTLRCYWNGGATVRETTQYLDVLPTPNLKFSVGPIAGFAPFTVDIKDLTGPAWLGEYGPNAWAYTMNTDGPSVFTQDGTFTYEQGLYGTFATSAKISFPLPLPLELQTNALTPNVGYVTGPPVEVLSDGQRPSAKGLILDDSKTLFLPLQTVDDAVFSSIRLRGISNSLPQKILDNGGYPDRSLMFWPVPSSGTVAVELWLWEPLEIYDLDAELNLPKGYERYYVYALATELSDTFGHPLTQEILDSLVEAESEIKTLNQVDFTSQPTDGALEVSNGGRPYNYIDFVSGAAMLPRPRE